MSDNRLPLGVKAKDLVSSWEGTIVARYEYMNGCCRYEIAGVDKDGKPEAMVFDGQQLEITDSVHLRHLAEFDSVKTDPEIPAAVESINKATGGDRSMRPVSR